MGLGVARGGSNHGSVGGGRGLYGRVARRIGVDLLVRLDSRVFACGEVAVWRTSLPATSWIASRWWVVEMVGW